MGPKKTAQERMEEYLVEQYGQIDYIITSFRPTQVVQDYNEMFAYLEGGDSYYDEFRVKHRNTRGNPQYADTFYGLLIREEMEERLGKIISQYFEEYQVYTSYIYYFPDGVDGTTSLDEVLAQGKMPHFFVNIFIKLSSYDGSLEEAEAQARQLMAEIYASYPRADSQAFLLTDIKYDYLTRYTQQFFISNSRDSEYVLSRLLGPWEAKEQLAGTW